MKYNSGEEFLNQLYKNMHNHSSVMHVAKLQDKPVEKIGKYLERLEKVYTKVREHDKKDMLLKYYYDKYVIKHLPESYVNLQKRILKEKGYGNIEYSDDEKKDMLIKIQDEQKHSLKIWLDYFISEDSMYPMWFKFYAFQGMLELANYDKKNKKFGRRTKTTVAPFIELNNEALAQVYNVLCLMFKGDEISNEQIRNLNNAESFKKLYTYFVNQTLIKNKSNEIVGRWVKYNQGNDYKLLWKSVQGKNTGWCTAGEENCKEQIKKGDFYVYYTKDNEENYTVPRIAIRMIGKSTIAEIRGVEKNQNLEGVMTLVLNEKLEELGDEAHKYIKKIQDMEMLTYIYTKLKNNNKSELSIDELKFLYEINLKIEGFGYEKDPRIKEIKRNRNEKKDYSTIFNCSEDEIAYTKKDLKNKKIKVFVGDLYLYNVTSLDEIILPENIVGNLDLNGLKSAEGLILPKRIFGNLNLSGLATVKGLKLPQQIFGGINLEGLKKAEGLKLPEQVNGNLNLRGLVTADNLQLPEKVIGDLYLDGLITAEKLILPKKIIGRLSLDGLSSAKGLKFPKQMSGTLYLSNLKDVEDLVLPEKIAGDLWLDSLITANGLKLPNQIDGYLYLGGLKCAEGLVLPEQISGDVILDGLISLDDLRLPFGLDWRKLKLPINLREQFIKNLDLYFVPDEVIKLKNK